MTVQNVGNQDATGVSISEIVPPNTTFSLVASSIGWDPTGTSFNIGNLGAGGSTAVLYAVTIDNTLPAGVIDISNTASVADDGVYGLDPNPADNSANITTPVTAAPDLSITKDDGGVTAAPGSPVVYTLTIQNLGDQDATGVVVTESVPAHTTFNAALSDIGWDPTGSSFTIGNLAAGASTTVLYAVTVDSALPVGVEQLTNGALVADDGLNGPDLTPGNNFGTDTTPVDAAPDLSITKDDGSATTIPGAVIVYTITVQNVGNQDATGVVVSETVPANTTFNAGSSSVGWDPTGTSFAIGSLAAGATTTITYAVTIDLPFAPGTAPVDNTASVADDGSNGIDPDLSNNVATDSTPIFGATIGDFVWLDLNADGVADPGEPGLPNVQVQLTWFGYDGLPGGGDDLVLNTTTDLNGNYTFMGLAPGNFQVDVNTASLPEPLVPTFDLDGIGTPNTAFRALPGGGQTGNDVDFGYAGTASIGDRIWNDLDNNGNQDAGEPGFNGITAQLTWAGLDATFGTADDYVTTQVTAGDGNYQFNNLPAGAYQIAVDTATLPTGAIQTFDPDATLDNQTTLTLTSGEARTDVDFGYNATGSIAVFVYEDLNVSGSFDAGEPGIGGVTFHVTGLTNLGANVAFDVVTLPDGTIVISSLEAGTYRIAEVQPAGFLDKDETVGGIGVTTVGGARWQRRHQGHRRFRGSKLDRLQFWRISPFQHSRLRLRRCQQRWHKGFGRSKDLERVADPDGNR